MKSSHLQSPSTSRAWSHCIAYPQCDRIAAYASFLRFRRLETTLETARTFVERGFRAMKIKIGQNPFDPSDDLNLVKAIRQEVGDRVTLMGLTGGNV